MVVPTLCDSKPLPKATLEAAEALLAVPHAKLHTQETEGNVHTGLNGVSPRAGPSASALLLILQSSWWWSSQGWGHPVGGRWFGSVIRVSLHPTGSQ